LIFQYLAPLSDNKDERLYLVDWFFDEDADEDKGEDKYKDKRNQDIRQFIVTAFHAHNKDILRKVLPVIENTEIIIRYKMSQNKKYTDKKAK